MKNKMNLQKNEDGTYIIGEEELLWLLGCTKDILEQDLPMHYGLPSERLVKSNLNWVKEAIENIE